MKLLKVDPNAAVATLEALVVVARAADGGLARPQRAFLDAVQRTILETDLKVDALPPATPEQLAHHLHDQGQARQLVRLMVVTCLASGLPSKRQIALLNDYATALAVDEPAISVISHLARGRIWRFRLAFLRRSHLRYYFRNTYRISGSVLRVVKATLIFRGVLKEDADLVDRYRALGRLPEDRLGYQFFRHLTDAPLPFPGEHGGFPEGAIFHDFAHVLAGFDTSPEGEMQAAAFQAGFTRGEHDFFTWLFSIVLHTTGINLLPFSIPLRPGRIGEGTLATDVLCAMQRGAALSVDLGTDWDYWSDVDKPIATVRQRLGAREIAQPYDAQGRVKPGVVLNFAGRSAAVTDTPVMA
jgi:hypothetical protein